jgi:Ala-tRNA(Pro) deacylase
MTALAKLKTLLDEKRIAYEVLSHRPAYTAQDVAAAQHVPGREMAKVVVAKAGDRFVMAVLPAPRRLDLEKLAACVSERTARLATEDEMMRLFPGCDPGAEPPFGSLFGIPVYVDESLTADEHVVCPSGSCTETIRLRSADFAAAVRPVVADLTLMREEPDASV